MRRPESGDKKVAMKGVNTVNKTNRWPLIILVAAAVLGVNILLSLAGEYLWFRSLGTQSVFMTQLWARMLPPTLCVLFYMLFALGNLAIARKWWRSDQAERWLSVQGQIPPLEPWQIQGMLFFALGMSSVLMLLMGYTEWLPILRWMHREPFGLKDPIFARDASFYVFTLPFLLFIRLWLLVTLVATLLLVCGAYLVKGAIQAKPEEPIQLAPQARTHLCLLAALLVLLLGWGFWLGQFRLLTSSRGTVFGVGYADVYARIFSLKVLALGSLTAAAMVAASIRYPKRPLIKIAVMGLAGMMVLFNYVIPGLIQGIVVKPNELAKETPYIAHNLEFTRFAYGLNDIQEEEYPFLKSIPQDQIIQDKDDILRRVKIWDYRVLKESIRQRQELRPYYVFSDVDEDRYSIQGKLRQVMLSARELSVLRLPGSAQNWVQRHLQYTHGYGVCMTPVELSDKDGGPSFLMSDIPTVSPEDLKLDRPEIYFGENTGNYALVKLRDLKEFDYPVGDENVEATYQGNNGVPLNSLFTRIVLAKALKAPQILFSKYFQKDTLALYHRDIVDRASRLAPFLEMDHDPYMVVADGKLYWILDAYTVSKGFPYSRAFPGLSVPEDERPPTQPQDQESLLRRSLQGAMPEMEREIPFLQNVNYIRNSVKVVIDAYEGTVKFYIVDDKDPILRAFRKAFPSLFSDLKEMSPALRSHLRYPRDLFKIQAATFCEYHMKDPKQFFQKEDAWQPPGQVYSEQKQWMEPYYIMFTLPGESRDEFVNFLPFTPLRKDNMIAFMCARSDEEHYGELRVYKLPKRELIYGPMQMEAKIDQNPDISAKLSLWNQKGSKVIRGNLLVIPVAQSFLYVEPIYLLATTTEIPEVKQVIVAGTEEMAMESSAEKALIKAMKLEGRILALEEAQATEARAESDASGIPLSVLQQVTQAREALEAAKSSLKDMDWSGFGAGLQKAEELLKELEASTSKEE